MSLLPSATEIVCLLGLGDSLVGVTHECDWPPDARGKRVVTCSNLPEGAAPAEIDRLVAQAASGGAPTQSLDQGAIRELAPDLVLTQDLCAVCAVPAGHLRAALDVLGVDTEVLSLDPASLDDVLAGIVAIGAAAGAGARAAAIVEDLRARLRRVEGAVAGLARPKVLALEWGDPPFNAGHWIPEMIELAGGEVLAAIHGAPSRRMTWEEVTDAAADVVVFMPCGFDLAGATAQVPQLLEHPALADVPTVFAAGANDFYSRPGPRLVDGVEALASVLHEECGLVAAPGTLARVR